MMRRDGFVVNRKRVKRLMRVMGIEAIYQKPNTSLAHPAHKVYPYLLRGLLIDGQSGMVRRHHLCADGEGVCVSGRGDGLVQPPGLVVAGVDYDGFGFLRGGAARGHGAAWAAGNFQYRSESSVTSADFMAELEAQAVRISMDGKGRYLDNIFIERLWRSLKYEDIFLKA